MADNVALPASGVDAAADETTYSGDTVKLQIVRLVHVTGSEGSKVVAELVRLEDSAHTSGDPGIPFLAVRQDTAASLAGTDGDYTIPISDASGRLWVNVGASALPTGAASEATLAAAEVLLDSIDTALSSGTLAVAAASLPLPAGAATSALQTDIINAIDAQGIDAGTAGSAATDVVTVQGIASMTPVAVSAASLPLPSGASTETTLASALTALQVIDDWDESDRAKVNPVVGQAGVDGGSGAITAKTQRVTQAGLEYETVAASQTAQALGATGATGDHLSHVNVQPTSTTAGVVTILDNTTEVHAYPGGTVGADLKPFTIPIGAISVSGAWKITTGAGVKCTAFGNFT